MRLAKSFVLVVVLAMASISVVGVATASATAGNACVEHTSLTCETFAETFEVENEGNVVLLNSLANILCLTTKMKITFLVKLWRLSLLVGLPQKCGTNASHTNCEVEFTELPDLEILKTGLDEGTLKSLNGKVHVHCKEVTIFKLTIDCEYDGTGLEFPAGGQHATATKIPTEEIGEGTFCSKEQLLDGLLVTTSNVYILG